MAICNYPGRIRSQRTYETVQNLVEQTSTGLLIDNNNPVLATKDGEPVAMAVLVPGGPILVDQGENVDTTPIPMTIDAWGYDTTELGSLVARNAFAHIGGPRVHDSETGFTNNDLTLRGYATGIVREKDDYAGINLYHDGTDGIITLESGSFTQDDGGICKTNFTSGETARIRVTGVTDDIGTEGMNNLPDRTLTFEFQTAPGDWVAKFMISQEA